MAQHTCIYKKQLFEQEFIQSRPREGVIIEWTSVKTPQDTTSKAFFIEGFVYLHHVKFFFDDLLNCCVFVLKKIYKQSL